MSQASFPPSRNVARPTYGAWAGYSPRNGKCTRVFFFSTVSFSHRRSSGRAVHLTPCRGAARFNLPLVAKRDSNARAFCRSVGPDRFMSFAMRSTGVFAFECARSSFTSAIRETASNSLLFGFLGLLGHKSTPFNEAPFYHARPCTQDDFPHVTIPREGRHLDGQYNVIGSRTVRQRLCSCRGYLHLRNPAG